MIQFILGLFFGLLIGGCLGISIICLIMLERYKNEEKR